MRALQAFLSAQQPVIAFVRTVEFHYAHVDSPHAVVVVGMDDVAIHLLDPDYPEQTPVAVSIDEFALAWAHFDQAYAVIATR